MNAKSQTPLSISISYAKKIHFYIRKLKVKPNHFTQSIIDIVEKQKQIDNDLYLKQRLSEIEAQNKIPIMSKVVLSYRCLESKEKTNRHNEALGNIVHHLNINVIKNYKQLANEPANSAKTKIQQHLKLIQHFEQENTLHKISNSDKTIIRKTIEDNEIKADQIYSHFYSELSICDQGKIITNNQKETNEEINIQINETNTTKVNEIQIKESNNTIETLPTATPETKHMNKEADITPEIIEKTINDIQPTISTLQSPPKLNLHPSIFKGILSPIQFLDLISSEEEEKENKKDKKVKRKVLKTKTKKINNKRRSPIFSESDSESEIKIENPITTSDIELAGLEYTPPV